MIIIFFEKKPLSSIGFRLQWQSVLWGLLIASLFILFVSRFIFWIPKKLGISGFEGGFTKLVNLPIWYLVLAAVTAGFVEETFYRGYAIERLARLTHNYWWAGLIALTMFALVHLPVWGWGPVFTFYISGGLFTLFYIWRQDLFACIIAHAIIDSVGLVTAAINTRRSLNVKLE